MNKNIYLLPVIQLGYDLHNLNFPWSQTSTENTCFISKQIATVNIVLPLE